MTLSDYFAKPDTPGANSPVGTIMVKMVKVLEKYPGTSFEAARAKAHVLLLESAGKKRFNLPKILSEAELAAQKERLKVAWKPRIYANAAISSTASTAISA